MCSLYTKRTKSYGFRISLKLCDSNGEVACPDNMKKKKNTEMNFKINKALCPNL